MRGPATIDRQRNAGNGRRGRAGERPRGRRMVALDRHVHDNVPTVLKRGLALKPDCTGRNVKGNTCCLKSQ